MNGHRNVVEWMICNGGARVDCVDSDGETIFGLLARLVFALPTLHRVCYDLLITSWFRYGLDEMASFVHNLKQQQQQQPSTLQTTPKEVSWQQRMAEAIIREADVEPSNAARSPSPPPPLSRTTKGIHVTGIGRTLTDLNAHLASALAMKQDVAMKRAALQREEERLDATIATLCAQIATLTNVVCWDE